MESPYHTLCRELPQNPRRWLVTGAAGFIGSNLVEQLLRLGQEVTGLDNFATGQRHNLVGVQEAVGAEAYARFQFIEGDVSRPEDCQRACDGVRHVLHQAALGSVPRSVNDPFASHVANVDGFLAMALAARDAGAESFVYASSSSVYGDHPDLPKQEDKIGQPLSPYAATKFINEVYAAVLARCYEMKTIGMRYFNVVGPRQDPNGPYAAVIPRWIAAFIAGQQPVIFGDGETSRDFCPIENVVQANLLASVAGPAAAGQVLNIALGERTTLNQLLEMIRARLVELGVPCAAVEARYQDFRVGDVRHSLADISRAAELIGYQPETRFAEGLAATVAWYLAAGDHAHGQLS